MPVLIPIAGVPKGTSLRLQLERIEALPLRAASAWDILERQPEFGASDRDRNASSAGWMGDAHGPLDLDPAFVVNGFRPSPRPELELVAGATSWTMAAPQQRAAINRLWLHACAVAARCDSATDRSAAQTASRLALIRRLGAWALAVAAPDALCEWSSFRDAAQRAQWERDRLGEEMGWIGRRLAHAWGLSDLAVESTWLVDEDGALDTLCPGGAAALGILREAEQWIAATPLALFAQCDPTRPGDTPVWKTWVAEFQSKQERNFFQGHSSPREALLVREQARRILELRRLKSHSEPTALVKALAASSSSWSPQAWARGVQEALAAECADSQFEVLWLGQKSGQEECESSGQVEPPDRVIALSGAQQRLAEIRVWSADVDAGDSLLRAELERAWSAWAGLVAELERRTALLRSVVAAARGRTPPEPTAESPCGADALREFAAGAGHELNNPLAVIMGRAQLLLQRTQDPEAQRSLRVMIAQCQRAHRMLRDLMYVSRPVERRDRMCSAADTLRRCLDDLHDEAQARGISIRPEIRDPLPLVLTDPEQLRHLADVLVRNALEASSSGGEVVLRCEHDEERLIVEVWDQGRGFSREEARQLFVPFYCGRHAGRGLGLGLPRIAHYVGAIGGTLKWSSKPGIGTVFRVALPAPAVPQVSAA